MRSVRVAAGAATDATNAAVRQWAAEWQAAIGHANAFVRYSGRQNVEHVNTSGSYDQRDASAQIFANLPRGSQAFGTAIFTRTASVGGSGSTYWQAGGGTQLRMGGRDLWLRAEANAARNVDLLTGLYVPRESFVFGLNGQMSRRTTIAMRESGATGPGQSAGTGRTRASTAVLTCATVISAIRRLSPVTAATAWISIEALPYSSA